MRVYSFFQILSKKCIAAKKMSLEVIHVSKRGENMREKKVSDLINAPAFIHHHGNAEHKINRSSVYR